jgi:hypothetical protein
VTSLNFGLNGTAIDATGANVNYHFQAAPKAPSSAEHAPMMFANLLSLILGMNSIDRDSLTLTNSDTGRLYAGDDVPADITQEELGMTPSSPARPHIQTISFPQLRLATVTFPTCGGGGGGLCDEGGCDPSNPDYPNC